MNVKIDAAEPASLPQSLAFAPALDVKIDAAYPRHFLKGLSRLNLASVSQSLAFALALDVKIDAAKSSTHSRKSGILSKWPHHEQPLLPVDS